MISMPKIGRNELCWCGSGKKFKRCHQDRDRQPPLTKNDENEFLKKILKSPACCMYPLSNTETCDKPAVDCHTLQRRGSLLTIADTGHVYRFNATIFSIEKSKGDVQVERVGIGEASSFPLFCNNHDKDFFSPIEDSLFIPDLYSSFLLAYRAVCQTLYTTRKSLEIAPMAREIDRGRDWKSQMMAQDLANWNIARISKILADVEAVKKSYDLVLLDMDFQDMKYYAIKLDKPSDVMCSSMVSPPFDFHGNRITNPRGHLTISSFSSNGVGWIVFAWPDTSESADEFVNSFNGSPQSQKPHALLRLLFSGHENIYFSPKWWHNLPPAAQKALKQRFWHPQGGPDPHPQPTYFHDDGFRLVNWNIIDVLSNMLTG